MTIEVEATREGASQDGGPESVHDLFLNRLTDAHEGHPEEDTEENLETTSNEDEAEDEDAERPSDDEAEDESEGTEETDDTEESEAPKAKRVDDDDAVVSVRFDDKDIDVPVKDLKRLYGQEKALNRKSEEASETKRNADQAYTYAATALKTLFDKAKADYAIYEGVNLNVLAMREGWDADTLETVTEQEKKAYQNLHFLSNELQQITAHQQQTEHANAVKATNENRSELFDPVHGIKDFSDEKLMSLGHYAINELGFEPSFVQNFGTKKGDAKLVKALFKLQQLERKEKLGANALETKTSKPKPAPTKVLKSSANNKPSDAHHDNAMRRLKKDNSSEAIQDAFMARMGLR